MVKALKKLKTTVVIAITLLFAVSCSSVRANLIKDGSLQLEAVPSSVKISSVRVYQKGDVIQVSGEVSKRKVCGKKINGHVDIALFAPEKELLRKVSINYGTRNIPLKGHGKHRSRKHFDRKFKAAIPLILPQGSMIKIAFHNVPFDGSSQTDCGQSMATI